MKYSQNAFDAAVEIVAATLSNEAVHNPNAETGEDVGDFFQAIYRKLVEVETEQD